MVPPSSPASIFTYISASAANLPQLSPDQRTRTSTMDHGYRTPEPTVHATGAQYDEPLFTSVPEDRTPDVARAPHGLQPQQPQSTFGAPPMGEPSEPSAHPDNITAARQTPVSATQPAPSPTAGGLGRQSSGSFTKAPGGLGRQPSGSFPKATAMGGGGGGLRRQASGAYDATSASKTGLFGGATAAPTAPSVQRQEAQPGLVPPQPTTIPVGSAPSSPYMKTEEVPPSGTSPMNLIVENFNKYRTKAEGLAGNIWSHMKTGPSVTDAARGRVSQGIKLVQEGGFEGLYKSTFGPMPEGEQLRKTYACYLSTSTGPVAGTLYISNLKFSFSSDRPLAYKAETGLQAWSYYKMVVPLDKVREVVSSFNENKPLEKYIQVATSDGHDFWFMGFVNYDKGVKNMQLALKHIGEIDPNGGLKAPWAGMSVPGMKKQGSTVPAAAAPAAGHNPIPGGPPSNQPYPGPVNPTL